MFGHLESSPQDSTCCQHYENSTAGRGQWSARESEKVLDGVGGKQSDRGQRVADGQSECVYGGACGCEGRF